MSDRSDTLHQVQGIFYLKNFHEPERVLILFHPDLLLFQTKNAEMRWPKKNILWDFNFPGVVKIKIEGSNESLEIHDRQTFKKLKDEFGPKMFYKGIPTRHLLFPLSILGLAASLLFIVFMCSGPLSSWCASLIPLKWEAVLEPITQSWKPCESAKVSKVLQKLILTTSENVHFPYQVELHIVRLEMSNAFATPGGKIFFTEKLIEELKSPEEMIGILGHEMGHVYHRHILASVIRSIGFLGLINFLLTNLTGIFAFDSPLQSELINLKFSRADELEADTFGAVYLEKNGISPKWLAEFFDRLSKKESGPLSFFEILSTHPMSQQRSARLLEISQNAEISNLPMPIDQKDWKVLKEACKGT